MRLNIYVYLKTHTGFPTKRVNRSGKKGGRLLLIKQEGVLFIRHDPNANNLLRPLSNDKFLKGGWNTEAIQKFEALLCANSKVLKHYLPTSKVN